MNRDASPTVRSSPRSAAVRESAFLSSLIVTPDNHAAYDCPPDSPQFRWCYQQFLPMIDGLQDLLGGREDWCDRYHKWLSENGYRNQSDNGWPSVDAVEPRVLREFIAYARTEQGEATQQHTGET